MERLLDMLCFPSITNMAAVEIQAGSGVQATRQDIGSRLGNRVNQVFGARHFAKRRRSANLRIT